MQTVERHRTTDGEYNSSICIRNCSFVLTLRATKGQFSFLVARLGLLCVTSPLEKMWMHALIRIPRWRHSVRNTCNTYKITSCARITQPASSWMRTSLTKGRVCFTCVLKGVFLLPPHRKRTNASSAPKGRVATSLSESIRAHGHLRFLLRSFLPFRESFILSDGHVLRLMYSRQNYEAAHEEKKQRRRESFFTQNKRRKVFAFVACLTTTKSR